jgi:Putative beta-barrel porin 2
MNRLALIAIATLLVSPTTALMAQDTSDPSETARFRFGPLRFTPSVALTNIGVDNNVFNEVQDPKRDTTTAIGPAVTLWMKMGPSRLSGKASTQYLYYKDYDNQRSWNNGGEARWEVPLARLLPFVGGSYANTRERPGFEIDSRARRRDDTVVVGTEVRLSSKTTLIVDARRARFDFDQDETFFGANLAKALNRTSSAADLKVRYRATPLTTFAVFVEDTADRFVSDPLRNANSLKVMSGIELKPFALIAGSAFIGVRRFNALDANVPDYQGLVAGVDATYTIAATRLGVKVNRDLAYSYEPMQPYYGLTDVNFEITERVTRAWDIVGRGGWQWLDYQQVVSASAAVPRADLGRVYGAGIGYRVGETLRFGVDANYYQRTSPALPLRDYQGFRVGASFSYGLSR